MSPLKKPPLRDPLQSDPNQTAAFEALLKRADATERYEPLLYVTGTTPRSRLAIANIRSLCEEYLAGRHDLQVIDIYQQPAAAADAQIIAAPTLVKKAPLPPRRLIGDLSDRDRVIVGLNLVAPIRSDRSPPATQWLKL